MRGGALVALWIMLCAGCVSPAPSETASITDGGSGRPVTIALLDTGTNPYLPTFATDAAALVAAIPSIAVTTVALSTDGSISDRLDKDNDLWVTLAPRTLYHFAGTRVLAISFDSARPYPHTRDAHQHGAATSYLAAREAPDAVIVAVQVGIDLCTTPPCSASASIADGMEWIAEQDWIDIVSVSLANPVNQPERPELEPAMARYLRASERAAREGKIVLNGAGNNAAPPLPDHFNGPPWIIAVGGVESAAKGESLVTGRGVDLVSNFSDFAPKYIDGEMEWRSGTSFATPIVAGTLARAMAFVRAADPAHASATEAFRHALNATGIYFDPTSWDGRPPGRDPLPFDAIQYASLPIVAQPQMGWGYVDGAMAVEIAARVLADDFSIPPGKGQAARFQPAWQTAREEFWDRYAPRS